MTAVLGDFQTEWDDLTYRLIEAFIDDDSYRVNELVDEASKHPDLHAVLINLASLAANLALVFNSGTSKDPSCSLRGEAAELIRWRLPHKMEQRRASAAKRDVEQLMRLGGAE